jgi:hypothetical protein
MNLMFRNSLSVYKASLNKTDFTFFLKQLKLSNFLYIFGQEFVLLDTHINHALLIRRCITELSVKIVFTSCIMLMYYIILLQTSFVFFNEAQNF